MILYEEAATLAGRPQAARHRRDASCAFDFIRTSNKDNSIKASDFQIVVGWRACTHLRVPSEVQWNNRVKFTCSNSMDRETTFDGCKHAILHFDMKF